ncbi:MAG: LCP family protein [Bacillota bacterium]
MRRFFAGAALGLLLSAGGLFLLWMLPLPGRAAPPQSQESSSEPSASRPVYVLVLGVDERPDDPGRSDTIFVVRAGDGQVRALSIPRDTLVEIDGYGEGKANSAYTYGGPELAKQTVSALLGLPVDHYVKVNLQGFREMVDLVGGVPFEVDQPMYYEDPYDGLVIDLKPGRQVLDGRKAEQFVRFRHDEIGDDLGRIHRQQEFLKAAAKHALQPSNLTKLPSLLYTASRYVETDLPTGEQFRLARAAFQAQQAGAIVQETLPGYGDYVGEVSFYLPDVAEMERLVEIWRAAQ